MVLIFKLFLITAGIFTSTNFNFNFFSLKKIKFIIQTNPWILNKKSKWSKIVNSVFLSKGSELVIHKITMLIYSFTHNYWLFGKFAFYQLKNRPHCLTQYPICDINIRRHHTNENYAVPVRVNELFSDLIEFPIIHKVGNVVIFVLLRSEG